MKIIGLDLAGPRNLPDTYLTIFEEAGAEMHFVRVVREPDDQEITGIISNLGRASRVAIGIDAPLSYNPAGGDRESDKELRRLVLERGRGIGVMPPTMIRMVYLTLHGIALTRMLETLKPKVDLQIVEVHPGASLLLRGAPAPDVSGFKHDVQARLNLLHWMEQEGLKNIPRSGDLADHFVASCAAALGAWRWSHGKAVWVCRAQPPAHPYDFAC